MRITVAALLLLAAAAPAAGAPWLSRAAWPQRAPRAGIAAWLACSLSVVLSLALAGMVLAIPCVQLSTDPAMLHACLSLLRAQYASPAGAATGIAGGHDGILAVEDRRVLRAAEVRELDVQTPEVYTSNKVQENYVRAVRDASGMTKRAASRPAPKRDDGRFDFYVAMNGRNDWHDLE